MANLCPKMAFTIHVIMLAVMSSRHVYADMSTYAYLPEHLSEATDKLLDTPDGGIPDYINGYLIQYQCGSFGHLTDLPTTDDEWEDLSSISFISHVFDCISMMVRYDLTDSMNVYYSAQYLETKPYIIWESNDFDMTISRVAWDTLYASPDADGFKEYYFYGGYRIQANRQLWEWDEKFYAVGYNYTILVEVDPYSLETLDLLLFDDDNVGFNSYASYPPQLFMQSSYSHADWAGNLYSVLCVFVFSGADYGTYEWVVYKIEDNKRTVVTSYSPDDNTFDYGECGDGASLTIQTMVNDFIVIGNYIILPVMPVLVDYCALLARELESGIPTAQSFYDLTSWSKTDDVELVVIHLDSDLNLDTIETVTLLDNNFYILDIVNAYIDDSDLVIDLMVADSSEIMKEYFNVSHIVDLEDVLNYETKIRRLTLGVEDDSFSFFFEEVYYEKEEIIIMYPTINPFWANTSYQYIYFVYNVYKMGSYVIKIDLEEMDSTSDSSEFRTQWPDPSGDYIITSPIEFIPNPTGTAEDDGILVFNVVDPDDGMGYLAFLDASEMSDPTLVVTSNQSTVVTSSKFYYTDDIPVTGMQQRGTGLELTVWLTVVGVLVAVYSLLMM